jgi:hypothetical protein
MGKMILPRNKNQWSSTMKWSIYVYMCVCVCVLCETRFGKYSSTVDVSTVAVGRGTALQAEKSWVWFPMVSLEFFLHLVHPATLCPWGSTQPLTEMTSTNIYWLDKGARCIELTSLQLLVPIVRKYWLPVQACDFIALPLPYSSIASYVCHIEGQIGTFARVCTFYHIINILWIGRTDMCCVIHCTILHN